MLKSVYLRTSRHPGIDVYGTSPHNIVLLAWPLILQWRKESAKYPDTELRIVLTDGAGWSINIKNINRDTLTEFVQRSLWG